MYGSIPYGRGRSSEHSRSPPQRFDQEKKIRRGARWGEGPRVGPHGTLAERLASVAPHAMKKTSLPLTIFFLNPISAHTNYVFKRNYLRASTDA